MGCGICAPILTGPESLRQRQFELFGDAIRHSVRLVEISDG
jgi:hypothetical protein